MGLMDIILFTIIDRNLVEVIIVFLVMAISSVARKGINKTSNWDIGKTLTKVFVNFIAGVSLYSLLLSYSGWFGDYPQKLGVAMFVTYIGEKVVDVAVEEVFKKMSIEAIKKYILKIINP